jgi:hypothetical protein
MLEAPPADMLKRMRDRATLGTLFYRGLRREELCGSESGVFRVVTA